MARYINAERLKDSMFAYYECLEESANGRPYKGDTLMDYEVVDMIEDCIDSAPTADVAEVKHGEWVESQYVSKKLGIPVKNEFIFACSVCGHDAIGKSKYCPNCGADMRERRTDDGDL